MATKILVVEDDLDYQSQLRMQLEGAGYEVIAANGLGEAKEMFAAHKVDLAIVDLMLEDWDGGFTFSFHVKQADPSIPVIIVSAVTSETGFDFDASTPEERSWIKADLMLHKPLRFEQLQQHVTRLLKS